jgi:hypothetical protein
MDRNSIMMAAPAAAAVPVFYPLDQIHMERLAIVCRRAAAVSLAAGPSDAPEGPQGPSRARTEDRTRKGSGAHRLGWDWTGTRAAYGLDYEQDYTRPVAASCCYQGRR